MRRYGDDVVQRLFQTDADQAVAAAQVIFPEGQRGESRIYWGYQEWVRSDRKTAEDWLAKEADSGVREQIKMQQAANEDSAAFLASISPATDLSGAFMSECLNDAMRRMAREQPSEALRWLLANPEQITRQRVWDLYHENFSMGAADIMSVPEGKGRDTLVDFAASNSLFRQNWGEAADLLPLVTDPAK